MAFLPTIPTSFLPHSAEGEHHFRSDFSGAFGFFAYFIFGAIFLLALGVFFYGRILLADKVSKDQQIAAALAAIDLKTVESFVQLRNRLTLSETLLVKHAAFSSFFASLEEILPGTVRFSKLRLALDASGAARVEGSGLAKSFNALAAVSTALAADGRFKDAIFSNITINKDNSVSFVLAAALDPGIIVFSP